MEQNKEQYSVRSLASTNEPEVYDVIFLNDDFTTMDFVVEVLKKVFFHNGTVATSIMLTIHKKDHALSVLIVLTSLSQNSKKP